jgi:hypothetical protein
MEQQRKSANTAYIISIAKAERARVSITPALFEVILERIADGATLDKLCQEPGMPSRSAVYAYMRAIPDAGPAWMRRLRSARTGVRVKSTIWLRRLKPAHWIRSQPVLRSRPTDFSRHEKVQGATGIGRRLNIRAGLVRTSLPSLSQ